MTEPEEPAAPPVRPGRVVGIAVALLVLVLAAAAILGVPFEPFDEVTLFREPVESIAPEEALAPHFAPGELPFDFRLETALRLATGEVVVSLENDDPRAEDAADEQEEDAETEESDGDGSKDDDRPDPEEFTVARRERNALEDGTPPTEVWLARYPRDDAESALARHFRRRSGDDDEPKLDETITLDGGRLPWGRYDADFVHERDYDEGGHFSDALRVNLTRGTQCWILFAEWPRDYRGSRAPVEALLEGLPPGA